MKKLYFFKLVTLLILFALTEDTAKAATYYVNGNTASPGNGTSWSSAYANLTDALNSVRDGDEIWVAAGTYQPNLNSRFRLRKGVGIYGGFAGTETSLAQRNWSINKTILKGNGSVVVHGSVVDDITSTTVLDGFTITGGTRGAIENTNASPTLRNLIIVDNLTTSGGIIDNSSASPTLINVAIIGNANGGSLSGAIYNINSSPTLINVTISGNQKSGIQIVGTSSPTLYNCIVLGNETGISGGGINGTNNLIQTGDGVSGAGISNSSPIEVFVDPKSPGQSADGDYSLKKGSIAINAGKNEIYTGLAAGTRDVAGNPRVAGYSTNGVIDLGAYEYGAVAPDVNGIVYVKKGSGGLGNAWSNAIGEVADALKAAKINPAIKQIWVAAGTYKPLYSPADDNFGYDAIRDNSFLLVKDIKVYGGFAGTEAAISERVLNNASNKSILSGDIGIVGDRTDNVYHVVVSAADVQDATLNGFTIQDSNANGSGEITVNGQLVLRNGGGGIFNRSSSPLLSNCTFTVNWADAGGGVYNRDNSSPIISHVNFINNTAASSGGAIYNENNSSPEISNSSFVENSSSNHGGAVYSYYYSQMKIINCLFTGNTANAGSVIFNNSSSPTFINATIAKNGNDVFAGSTIYLRNSIMWEANAAGHTATYSLVKGPNPTGVGNIDAVGLTEKDIFVDYANGDFRLKMGSPAINSADNNSHEGLSANTLDLGGNPRVFNASNGGRIDMGAYEYQGVNPMPATNGTVYVKKGTYGNGTSWTDAVAEVADALKAAKINPAIKQIWVAAGTYNPLYSPADDNFGENMGRANAFLLVKDVKLFGGFVGTETATSERDTVNWTNETILSGDIGVAGNKNDNIRHLVIGSGDVGSAQLNGFTITEGSTEGANSITVNSNMVSATDGGGIYLTSSSPVLSNLIIRANTANNGGRGGGIFNDSASPKLNNVLIANNSSVYTDGGGMYNYANSSPVLTNVTVADNLGTFGGGIYNAANSSPTIIGGNVRGNTARSVGGGVYNDDLSHPTFLNVKISGNNGTYSGGGLYNRSSSLKMTNVLFSGNKAAEEAGAFFNSGSFIFINVTISGNLTNNGSGVFKNSSNAKASRVYNSILYGNSSGVQNESSGLEFYNSVIQGSGGSGNWIAATGVNGGNNLDVDPKFIDPISHDTAPFTEGDYKLQPSSPAINKGDNNLYAGLSASTTDLADNLRVYNFAGGGIIDMGAYEYQGVPVLPNANGIVYVKKDGTGNGSSWTNAVGELADALKVAKANTAIKQIWVAAGTYKPLYSPADNNFGNDAGSTNAFLLVKDVKVYGGFAGTESNLSQRNFNTNVSTLSGDLGVSGNSYNVVISSGAMGMATLDGFTIRDGNGSSTSNIYVNGNQVYQCSGAGIYNSVSDADYKNLIIMNNSCGESGGGMFSYQSSVKLNHVTIKNNSARHGGAMANQDNSHATVINSLFFGNSSSEGGDAIYNVDESLPKFVNITVAQNTGGAKNGILNEQGAQAAVHNSIVWGGIKGSYQGQNSIVQYSTDATNGNIDASSLNDTEIFTSPTNNDFSLKNGSPVINKGSNTLYEAADGDNNNTSLANDKDLAGNSRVYNFATNGTIDLGAYEYQGTLSQTISFAALDAKTTASADFTLSATASSGLAVSYTSGNAAIADVYQDNGVWKVKVKTAGSVVITAKQAGNGDYAAANAVDQTLIITEAVLPVTITNYTAKMVNQTARLDWSVSSERDNRKFVIYRSGDDQQFTEIGTAASLGNTNTNRNYFFVDKQPLNGNNYYKLVQVDLDGKPTELGVKPLNFVLSAVNLNVYPNPTKDKVNVAFEAGRYNRIVLSSVDGKVLKSVALSAQQDQLDIDLTAYPIGTYFIRLTGAQQSVVKKVVKQ